ncbi:MAG: kelch repeat-containing protein, partial [Candidatus Anstonellales archaeon]
MASTCFDLYLYNFVDSKKHISDLQRYYTTALFLSGVTPITVGNRLFIIGGYLPNQSISNKIYEIDLSIGRYRDVANLPVPIYNYSAVYYNNNIYIYGGLDSNNNVYNRLFKFNVSNFSISELTGGPTRECHSSFIFDGKIYIFGGKNSSGVYSDMYCYDPPFNVWVPVNYSTQNSPQPRYEHKGIIYNNKYYIFGGAGAGSNIVYNDMWRYDPVDRSWVEINHTGDIPSRRFDHTMIVYNGKIYLHGGFNPDKGYLSDTYIYSFSDNKWDLSNDSTPVARSDHGSFIYDKYLVVFGGIGPCDVVMGVDIYDLEKDIWISSCCENNC